MNSLSLSDRRPSASAGGRRSAPRTRRRSLARREAVAGYLFAAPQLLGFAAIVIFPVASVLYWSLFDYKALSGAFEFIGLGNFVRFASDPHLGQVLGATAVFALLLVPSGIVLALVLAILINRKIPGINVFRVIYFSPALVALAAWSIVWQFIFLPDGLVNSFLSMLHVNGPVWLQSPGSAMVVVVLVQLFKGVGINMLIFLAALQGIPQELIEAARVDGASRWTVIRRIMLPLLAPEILMVVILMFIGSLKIFAQIQLVTNGGPGFSTTVLSYYIYQQAFGSSNIGYASALSVLLFVIMLLVTGILWTIRRRFVFSEQD